MGLQQRSALSSVYSSGRARDTEAVSFGDGDKIKFNGLGWNGGMDVQMTIAPLLRTDGIERRLKSECPTWGFE